MGGRRGRFSFLREEYENSGGEPQREPEGEPRGRPQGDTRGDPQAETGELGPVGRDPVGETVGIGAPVAGALGAGGSRGAGRPSGTGPRRRQRRRDPKALRNDPNRKVIGAYVRKDVKREVDRALEDEGLFPDGRGSLSLLVEGLLERWLDENGYGAGDGR